MKCPHGIDLAIFTCSKCKMLSDILKVLAETEMDAHINGRRVSLESAN